MNVSLPDELRTFVDEQVDEGATARPASTCARSFVETSIVGGFRALLVTGGESAPGPLADDAYFTALRHGLDDVD